MSEPSHLHPIDQLVLLAYGELPLPQRRGVDAHVSSCESCRIAIRELVETRSAIETLPSPDIPDSDWARMLHQATRLASEPATRPATGPASDLPREIATPRRTVAALAWRAGIAASLVIAGALGAFAVGATRTGEVRRLRSELADARAAAAVALLREPRSAERLRGVGFGSALLARDRRVSAAFALALRHDPSPNVRLAVLDAIESSPDHDALNAGILAALPAEPLPAVRLAMIDLVARMGDPRARGPLLAASETDADTAVRSRARAAVAELMNRGPRVRQ